MFKKTSLEYCDAIFMNKGKRPSILVVAAPSPLTGGGGLRALRSLREYARFFNTSLFIPWGLWSDKRLLQESMNFVRELKGIGVKFAGHSDLHRVLYKLGETFDSKGVIENLALVIPSIMCLRVNTAHYEAIIALHESWDAIYSGRVLAEFFDAPSAVLLQLPPFYGSRKRSLNIMKALLLWRKLISGSLVEKALFESEALIRYSLVERLRKSRYENVLRKYDIVLGVSRAVAAEMGNEWLNKVICLDPGVSLDEEDLEAMVNIRKGTRERGNHIVFGGRVAADKGLVEALIVFKSISKSFSGLKLVITGRMTPKIYLRVKRICRKLSIEDKVVFTGFIPREKRFEIVAKARLTLYPSHVDAFPYAVLESLHLGTPVIAYKIPAIEIYYGKSPGVELVEEMNLEALAVKTMDLLEKKIETIEPPRIKSWKEIMSEEVEIISKLTLKQRV